MQDNYSENSDPIEELFRQGFDNHEEMPPDGVWDNIAVFLDAAEKKSASEQTFLSRHWGKMLSGVGLISSVALWFVLTSKEEAQQSPISKEKKDTSFVVPAQPIIEETKSFKREERKGTTSAKAQKAIPKKKNKDSTYTGNPPVLKEEMPILEPVPGPVEHKEEVKEEEPSNLYDQMKKEKKESKQLFIEKKK